MITALHQIGNYAMQKSNESSIDQIIEDPNTTGKYNTVLVILFEEKGNEIVYMEIRMEEFTRENIIKYAYRSGPPRGGDYTPTSKITKLETTFKRIQKPLAKTRKKLNGETLEEKQIILLDKIFQEEDVREKIYNDLQQIEYQDNAVLTLALNTDQGIKYVGDFKIFIDQLKEKYEESFYFKKSYKKAERKSIGKNNVCYLCKRQADKTYGYVSTFKFYNLDKVGFTSGGFKRGEAWKNYPVCPECATILDQGRNYLEENLSARFCGVDYFIIPKTIFSTNEESRGFMFDILEELEEKRKFSLKNDTRAKLTSAEDELFSIMQDFDNYLNFNLMFYREENSAFRILLYVEDVLPSYIQKIFEIKRTLDKDPLYHELKGKEGKIFKLKFSFNLISEFFPLKDYEKTFLEITNSVFSQKKISYQILIKRFIEKLRERFRQGQAMSHANLKAFMILQFLEQLDLLQGRREEQVTMIKTDDNYSQKVEEFFARYPRFFSSDVKRAVFLEGVLARMLLDIQYNKRDTVPFRPRLNELKINEKIVKRLLPEIQNKLNEYKSNYYKRLERMISNYMLTADFNKISNTELSFYFTTGMNLAGEFKTKKETEEKDDKESKKNMRGE